MSTPMITPTHTRQSLRPVENREAGQRGELALAFARRGGKTALVRRYASAPFGSVRASYPDNTGMPELQITNPAGGLLGKDRLGLEVSLQAGSAATVLTQGATKAYRGPESSQSATFEVGENAFLEYLPHHLIPYAGSSHRLGAEFRLAQNSTLLAWDAVSAGRISRGERFAFDGLSSRTCILVDSHPEIADGFDLTGDGEHFDGYAYLGTLFVRAPESLEGLADALHDSLYPSPHTLASASAPGTGLCVVRVLTSTAEALYSSLNLTRARARTFLDLPAAPRDVR